MSKTILITGSTDGIGLETAKMLYQQGHTILLHGRSQAKLAAAKSALEALDGSGDIQCYQADLSLMANVDKLASQISQQHKSLDILINNAGVFNAPVATTADGLDVRFAVNTLAPYLLTKRLMPLLGKTARIVNLSSAAQAPVDDQALAGLKPLLEREAYAQSKLALTMWTSHCGPALQSADGPMMVAVNPGSLLGSKMVKEAFGIAGGEISKGAEILCRAALSDEFATAGGKYFDNDAGRFGPPHPDALSAEKSAHVSRQIEKTLATILR